MFGVYSKHQIQRITNTHLLLHLYELFELKRLMNILVVSVFVVKMAVMLSHTYTLQLLF
jgi:hypothetical protein